MVTIEASLSMEKGAGSSGITCCIRDLTETDAQFSLRFCACPHNRLYGMEVYFIPPCTDGSY